jgi:hypothetical protein
MEMSGIPISDVNVFDMWLFSSWQDGVSALQELEVLEIVGARGLRIQDGLGQLRSLRELEFNACE